MCIIKQVKSECREVVKRVGIDNLTIEDLVQVSEGKTFTNRKTQCDKINFFIFEKWPKHREEWLEKL